MASFGEFSAVERARQAFASGKTLPAAFRRQQLLQLLKMLEAPGSRQKICEACFKDMRRSTVATNLTDIVAIKMEINAVLKHLDSVSKPKMLSKRLLTFLDNSMVRYEPFGVVLVIGTWNYPFYACLMPLVGAIAAGNCVVVKPSEMAQHSQVIIQELLGKYLDKNCYPVILGDAERTKRLLTLRFDYIFFTGSSPVGKEIYKQAASHLTPVTLELGGKSPVYIDDAAMSAMTVKRILWGKLINVGQTCIAPDYILCSAKVQEIFVGMTKEVLQEWYGASEKMSKHPDLSRIISVQHFRRLEALLKSTKGTILLGGNMDENDLWIEPTLVGNVEGTDSLMIGEIFGPILPFVLVKCVDDAISFIRAREKPLALYIFSKDDGITEKLLTHTSSGGACINDVLLQCSDTRLPFGGVGNSGLGFFHGRHSIKAFSHRKAVVSRRLNFLSEKLGQLKYPPYDNERKNKLVEMAFLQLDSSDVRLHPRLTHILALALGFLFCAMLQRFLGVIC